MASKIKGAQPPRPGPRTEVIRVTGTELQTFTLLSVAILGKEIHWYGGRSHECTKLQRPCEGCKSAWPVKWKGYVHVIPWRDPKHLAFLELTANAVNRLEMCAPEETSWRGCIVQIAKTKGKAKGRYVIQVLPRKVPDAELPLEEDPYPTLQFLWNCKNKHSTNGTPSVE